jgi:hypothetical protein
LGADRLAIAISKLSKPATTKEGLSGLLSQLDEEGVQMLKMAIFGTKRLSMRGGY